MVTRHDFVKMFELGNVVKLSCWNFKLDFDVFPSTKMFT